MAGVSRMYVWDVNGIQFYLMNIIDNPILVSSNHQRSAIIHWKHFYLRKCTANVFIHYTLTYFGC